MKNFKQKKNSPKRSDTVSIPTWAAPVVGPIAGLTVGGMMVLKMARRIEPGAEPLGPWAIGAIVMGAASVGLAAGLIVMTIDILKKK